jgi:hypothetical protein
LQRFCEFSLPMAGVIRLVVSVVREYRLVDDRSTSTSLLVRFGDWWKDKHYGLEVGGTSGDCEREMGEPFYHC